MPPRRAKAPLWGLLDPSAVLDGSEAPNLLGRIVADVDYPLAGYVPEDPRAVLNALPAPMEVTSCDVQQQISAASNVEGRARMTQLFGLDASKDHSTERRVVARTVITRLLRQHQLAYDALIDKHRSEVTALLERQSHHNGYMIVGIKTCVDAEMEANVGGGGEAGVAIEVPLQQVIAAFGAANPLGDLANPMVKVNRENFQSVLSKYVAKGERIFSLQVREVRYTGVFRKRLRMNSFSHFEPERGTFGGDEPRHNLDESLRDHGNDEQIQLESANGAPSTSSEKQTLVDQVDDGEHEASQQSKLDLMGNDRAETETIVFAELAM